MAENSQFAMKPIRILLAIAAIVIFSFNFIPNASALNLPECVLSDCNCSDFASQPEAQAVFDLFKEDVFNLDGNGDGIVCTSLPGAVKTPQKEVSAETSQTSVCTVVSGSIYDGDTMRVDCSGEELRIRFACIDAPEKAQDYGIEARDYLRSLLKEAGDRVKVAPITTDRYDRTVAALYVDRGSGWELLQRLQVLGGTAWGYEEYKDTCPEWEAIASAQMQAKAGNKGLWASPKAIPPWEWRRLNRFFVTNLNTKRCHRLGVQVTKFIEH